MARVSRAPIFSSKGKGQRKSKTSKKLPHNWHTCGGGPSAGGSGADCKLGLTTVRPSVLSTHETLGNWTDGRISCRHSALTSFLGYRLDALSPRQQCERIERLTRVRTEHWKWFSMTFQDLFMCIFQDFPGSLTSIFQDHLIEQVPNKSNFHIHVLYQLNNRRSRVWQWTMIMYVKVENMYTGQKCGNHLVYFPWLSRT